MSFFPQGTFYGLGMMGSSLGAFQYAENVVSDDIANVNTPGASQQQVIFNEAPPISGSPAYPTGTGASGDGVLVQTVQRINSESLDDLFRGANASQNYYTTQSSVLTTIQNSLGDPNSGISTAYASFQTAINQLVNSPSVGQPNSIANNVLTQAQGLATALNSASSTISTQEAQVTQQATTIVQTVNGILTQIAQLNGEVRATTAAGDTANTYEDQRDELIDQLSQYISVQTSVQADGSTLVSVNGQALVNDTVAYQLAAPTIGTATNGAPIFKINFATTPAASSSAAGIPLGSGQLAGLADLYNNDLVPEGQQLDQFASALANQTNRITEAGYTVNGEPGTALFQPIVETLPITAANIECGISDPSELPTVLASTASGSLVVPLNSANNTVDPSAALIGNGTLANPPTAAFAAGSTLTVTVDGVSTTLNYTSAAPPAVPAAGTVYADNIDDFVNSFNNQNLGVTASFDSTSQQIVFARDPSNEGLPLQAAQGTNNETPDFTITDSAYNAATPNTSLLGVLGAGAINGVDQNEGNAFGAFGEGVANSLVTMFSSNVGIPALQFTSAAAAVAGVAMTVAIPSDSYYSNTVQVGQVLTLDPQFDGNAPQENVTVSAVSYSNGVESVTFTPTENHAAGFAITSAPTQTLGQFYGGFITQLGIAGQTASSGETTQTSLATNINAERQSVAGINLDEETQKLIQYQSAYSAAAQTLNVLNQTIQTTITGLGVGTA